MDAIADAETLKFFLLDVPRQGWIDRRVNAARSYRRVQDSEGAFFKAQADGELVARFCLLTDMSGYAAIAARAAFRAVPGLR